MVYRVCLIHQNNAPNTEAYPYNDVVLIRDRISDVFRFPEQTGEPTLGRFETVSPELQSVLDTIPEGKEFEYLNIEPAIDGGLIMNIIVRDSTVSSNADSPVILGNDGCVIRVLMDEVRQGRICHVAIHSSVQFHFFHKTEGIPFVKAYYYEPNNDLLPKELALVPTSLGGGGGEAAAAAAGGGGVSPDIIHDVGGKYYKLPLVGYHGLSEAFVGDIFSSGLKSTKKYGMYGNDAYYFGSFHKAIRYSFRDSQYATMAYRSPLYKTIRPAGVIEAPNTLHLKRGTKDLVTDLIRDSPALIRFVLFPKSSLMLPRDLQNYSGKKKILKTLPEKKSGDFVNYHKTPEGLVKVVYSDDYINEQTGVPLLASGVSSVDYPKEDDSDLEIPEDSTREEVVMRLYRGIHVSTVPAFA